MNATSENNFPKTFFLPYQLGIYLAANAVSDACVVMDGANCVMPKIDFLAGSHDLYSTLLSPAGRHRVICTMSSPLPQKDNPERPLSAMLNSIAGSGHFSVVLVTGLPFLKLAGMDYEGLAASVKGGAPVVDVPPGSLEGDWLDGYALALDALARALPQRKVKKRRRSVALAGYLLDRNEGDHAANIKELRRLLKLCGLELACVFPSGGAFRELSRALEAEVVVSLPYGRKAAERIAGRTGAVLVETGLPLGIKGTSDWLKAVCAAAGIGELPPGIEKLERKTAAAIAPMLDTIAHRNVVYAGDPYLFAGFSAYAAELGMRVPLALIDSFAKPLGSGKVPAGLLFSPGAEEAVAAIGGLRGYSRPALLAGNSFALTEGFSDGFPFLELGFPSYGHHCLSEEPFFGFAGAQNLAGRLLNGVCGPEIAPRASREQARAV